MTKFSKLTGILSLQTDPEDECYGKLLWCGKRIVSEWASENLGDTFGTKKMVSLRYWTSDREEPDDAIKQRALENILGVAHADYGARYSELTGYLWTDEVFKVGGHDMISRLTTDVGKYLLLEMEVH